ncbi:MAG: hypothetical protein A4E67_02003 [Syntrophaceae bacterium PtaB.Bin038]|nr:MAG: hypothetical protein A4E67_02003 [Syntrophaceae bacterium PtaB.Bin038]
MTNNTLEKTTIGFGLSVAVVSILNALLLIVKETTPTLKKSMAAALGHHWTTHGVIVIGLFLVLGFVLAGAVKPESWSAGKLGNAILGSVIFGVVAVGLFYLLH